MTARRAGAAVLVTVGLAMVGCDTNECPAAWDPDVPESEVPTGCGPPAGYEDAVRERIGTGLYGHATYQRGDNVGPGYRCEYDDETLIGASVFELAPLLDHQRQGHTLIVEVRHDGTWEVALEPGVEYLASWEHGEVNLSVDRHEVAITENSIVLRDGQLALARIVLQQC